MDRLDYEFFLYLLKTNRSWLDETCFYFVDDSEKTERWPGCILSREKPYWIGNCDIPDGAEYLTAEELVQAPRRAAKYVGAVKIFIPPQGQASF